MVDAEALPLWEVLVLPATPWHDLVGTSKEGVSPIEDRKNLGCALKWMSGLD